MNSLLTNYFTLNLCAEDTLNLLDGQFVLSSNTQSRKTQKKEKTKRQIVVHFDLSLPSLFFSSLTLTHLCFACHAINLNITTVNTVFKALSWALLQVSQRLKPTLLVVVESCGKWYQKSIYAYISTWFEPKQTAWNCNYSTFQVSFREIDYLMSKDLCLRYFIHTWN